MTWGYHMRRDARRVRRYGVQPMYFMSPHDRLPETAAMTIARFGWRYRSELAPVVVTFLLAVAGWALHAERPRWWPFIAVAAIAASACAMTLGRLLGLATRAERVYAAIIASTAGGWLAAATALGPRHSPLTTLLSVGMLILAAPWWAHRRRRAKVRVDRTLAAWPDIAQATGLAGSRVQSAVVDTWGWRARFALARGQTLADVLSRLPAIESGLGTFRGAVRAYPTPDGRANRFELRVLDKDPHADAISWPGPSVSSISEPIDLGPFEDAVPAKVLFLRRHALFAGTTGSGKSGGLNVLLGNLAACADVVVWAIDLKRGMELGPWTPCIARLAITPAEARALLADAVAVLEARAEDLASSGRRVWEPTPELPALVIVVDEYAELAENSPAAAADADSIARRGRAVAVTLIAATQRPTQNAMGHGAIRSQMDVRISFRVRERKDTDLILGQGMLAAGWHAHTLNAPGKFLISAPEHDTPRRARAYLVTDPAVADTAARYAHLRPALDPISRQAIAGRAQTSPDEPAPAGSRVGTGGHPGSPERDRDAPDALLMAALSLAPPEGVTVPELIQRTGMSRPWVYQRLQHLTRHGRVTQVSRGRWRAPLPEHGKEGDPR
jgi:hypothetical protein